MSAPYSFGFLCAAASDLGLTLANLEAIVASGFVLDAEIDGKGAATFTISTPTVQRKSEDVTQYVRNLIREVVIRVQPVTK